MNILLFTAPCEGHEARFLNRLHRESNPWSLHKTCHSEFARAYLIETCCLYALSTKNKKKSLVIIGQVCLHSNATDCHAMLD